MSPSFFVFVALALLSAVVLATTYTQMEGKGDDGPAGDINAGTMGEGIKSTMLKAFTNIELESLYHDAMEADEVALQDLLADSLKDLRVRPVPVGARAGVAPDIVEGCGPWWGGEGW